MRIVPVFLLVFCALFQYAHPDPSYEKNCPPFVCGKHGQIEFPFTNTGQAEECGPFVVKGCRENRQEVQLERRGGRWYELEDISQADTISITDREFQNQLNANSCKSFNNLSFPKLPFAHPFLIKSDILTLFKCPLNVTIDSHLSKSYYNQTGCPGFVIYYPRPYKTFPSPPPGCSVIVLPANISNSYDDIFRLLTATFNLSALVPFSCYQCHLQRNCKEEFPHCNEVKPPLERKNETNNSKAHSEGFSATILIAASAAAVGIGALCVAMYCFRIRQKSKDKRHRSIETFLKNHGSLAPKKYRYTDLKTITKGFKEKLGQGGYGSVFKGKLPDGRLVAVKLLKNLKSNGEDFINEVASISRTSHVNIVPLFGFCFEGSKRALIYEFMSNGSLEKYIYEEHSLNENRRLSWERMKQIAVGIAQGLEYLHRGCNTRILHFDIKPHNILLDENFCPKISDFGLSKICPNKESIISLADPRGTVGYIAPEVFCRSIGGVSHKSDVYSYGMMILEMVGGRKNICAGVDHSSEIYFPHWIYNRLQLGNELGLRGINNDVENQIAKKMVLVSLWCIQTDPSNRPSMCRVVEMFQAGLDSLPIPPRPYLSSPSRSPPRSFTNSSIALHLVLER